VKKLTTRQKIINTYYFFLNNLIEDHGVQEFTKIDSLLISKFARLLDNQFGADLSNKWLYDYFSFQFEYWRTKETNFGKKGIALISWVIGKKAFLRYQNKNSNWNYFVISKLFKENPKISYSNYLEKVFCIEERKLNISNLSKIEEDMKKSILDKEENTISKCIIFSKLFHPKSQYCLSCKENPLCIKLQKEKFPKVFELRNSYENS